MITEKIKKRFHQGANNTTISGTMIGRIVLSTAGRDKDKYFLVIHEIDQNYVSIADGRLRHVNRPKKKKIRHLRMIAFSDVETVDKILKKELNDSVIRKILQNFTADPKNGIPASISCHTGQTKLSEKKNDSE